MESKNLVICDPETKFASAFAQYLTRQKELAVRVRTCSDLSYVLAIQEKEKIDFLFISSEYPEDSRKQVKAGMVFVIAPEREVALENREVPIYKYQPGRSNPGGNDSSVQHVRRREADIFKDYR